MSTKVTALYAMEDKTPELDIKCFTLQWIMQQLSTNDIDHSALYSFIFDQKSFIMSFYTLLLSNFFRFMYVFTFLFYLVWESLPP